MHRPSSEYRRRAHRQSPLPADHDCLGVELVVGYGLAWRFFPFLSGGFDGIESAARDLFAVSVRSRCLGACEPGQQIANLRSVLEIYQCEENILDLCTPKNLERSRAI